MSQQKIHTPNWAKQWILWVSKIRSIYTIQVDFTQSIFTILLHPVFRWKISALVLVQITQVVTWNILPLVLSYAFMEQNVLVLIGAVVGKIVLETVASFFWIFLSVPLQMGVMRSVRESAYRFFLETDPINHSFRESGSILNKVSRGSDSYEDLLDVIQFDFVNYISGLGLIFISLLSMEISIAIVGLGGIVLSMCINAILNTMVERGIRPSRLVAEDQMSQIAYEGMVQTPHIRSIFNTKKLIQTFSTSSSKAAYIGGSLWDAGGLVYYFLVVPYFLVIGIIGYMLFQKVAIGEIEPIVALGYISTFFLSTNEVLSIGRTIKTFAKSKTNIAELYSFIRSYGTKTFDV